MEPKDLLLAAGSPKELTNSLNFAFNSLVASDQFAELPKKDRQRIVFHWEAFRDFLSAVE